MGHACSILTFPASMKMQEIQRRCDDWGNANADLQERGYSLNGLGYPVHLKSLVFETRDEAEDYLEKTFGNYNQIAVKYKAPKVKPKTPKNAENLERRIKEYDQRIAKLQEPHFKGVKSKTVKCKHCGAVLPTSYCGRTFNNSCPVCREDLRPDSVLEKLDKYRNTRKELIRERDKELDLAERKASAKGFDLYIAVACEVHC